MRGELASISLKRITKISFKMSYIQASGNGSASEFFIECGAIRMRVPISLVLILALIASGCASLHEPDRGPESALIDIAPASPKNLVRDKAAARLK